MRVTVSIDAGLLGTAKKLAAAGESSQVVDFALRAFIEREAARRLAEMGGTVPRLKAVPRRNPARKN